MKRTAIKLVVFLLLGAVVNVAVAWGCAAWIDTVQLRHGQLRLPVRPPLLEAQFAHGRIEFRHYGGVAYSAYCMERFSITPTEPRDLLRDEIDESLRLAGLPRWVFAPSEQQAPEDWIASTYEAYGWPMRTLSCELYGRGAASGAIKLSETRVSGNGEWFVPEVLPLRPILPGLLINTLFYAALLWTLWSAPFATRRLIRKRRGRCLKCGYDLRHAEHEVCPECGA